MKLFLIVAGGLTGVIVLVALVGTLVLNNKYDSQPEADEFAAGSLPAPLLNGAYKGTQFTGLGSNWAGKQFIATNNEGINNFKGTGELEQRYPFQTSQQIGLRNKDLQVLQLDYNYQNNPLWLKFIKDEVVQVGPDKYLGKIHLKLGPLVVSLGYFRLEK